MPDAPRVVATAGHVDHGKSSLVEALTGMQPDRLAEERRRGMTIDLGFAWCTLPSGREVGFVDVPGHERFVRTMLAGVGPVRLVLFVVAADEGWRAQTEEHLAIVDVLGVDGAVIAITKRDLVDDAGLATTVTGVRGRLAGTALDGAPVVACSATTGAGLDDLRAALDAMLAAARPPVDDGRPRLWIDRVFTMKGAGTVVTGTLDGGALAPDDEVVAFPGGGAMRVRGVQTHRREVDVALPGSRVAVNLAATPRDALARGDVLAAPGTRRPTDVVDVALRSIRGADRMGDRGARSFHLGAAERGARVRVLGERDGWTYARLRLDAPVVADAGDRFVLRDVGRGATVAGGEVLDAWPPARPGSDAVERLAARRGLRGDALASLLIAERGAVADDDLRPTTGARGGAIAGATTAERWWFADAARDAVGGTVTAALEAYHRDHALDPGAPAGVARDAAMDALRRLRVARAADAADAAVQLLLSTGVVEREGAFLRLPSHRPAADDPALRRAVTLVESGGATPPTIADLEDAGVPRAAIDAAVRAGLLVRIAPTLVVTTAFVERALETIRGAGAAGMSVSALREALGTSRKYAVPLVEHLDATRRTRREGDLRVAR
jgi:selenocysteine-specific elongation factor